MKKYPYDDLSTKIYLHHYGEQSLSTPKTLTTLFSSLSGFLKSFEINSLTNSKIELLVPKYL